MKQHHDHCNDHSVCEHKQHDRASFLFPTKISPKRWSSAFSFPWSEGIKWRWTRRWSGTGHHIFSFSRVMIVILSHEVEKCFLWLLSRFFSSHFVIFQSQVMFYGSAALLCQDPCAPVSPRRSSSCYDEAVCVYLLCVDDVVNFWKEGSNRDDVVEWEIIRMVLRIRPTCPNILESLHHHDSC